MNLKKICLIQSLFLFFSFFCCKAVDQGPLLVIVLMVKNEEAVIRQTLEMYCKADPVGARIGYFIFDTGNDAWSPTMAKAKDLFDDYQLSNYFIEQEPFVDFSISRNRALRLAEARFPDAIFFLMPDAEWYLNNVESLLNFCQHYTQDMEFSSYLIPIMTADFIFHVPRLIRAHKGVYFEGVVHECVHSDNGSPYGPQDVFFEYPAKPVGIEISRKRWLRDKELLLKEHLLNPHDSRTVFYLAQTYECLGDADNAYYYYKKRTELKGFVEEDFMAHYRLGQIQERMITQDNQGSWPVALQHYLEAFSLRPTRAEPIIRIAAYYANHNLYDLAFLYAFIACNIKYPEDILFVEKDLYVVKRYEILAKAAIHIPLEIPRYVVQKALEYNEKIVPLEKNILLQAFCI